jgi:uncharacterized LabA/DUF88 family protein
MNRVTFLIDGFNLYHSTADLQRIRGLRVKWLNIYSFCSSFLHLLGRDAAIAEIYYFSAFAEHLNDPSIIKRHKDYIECLKSTGIIPEMGRFKPKEVTCPLHNQLVKSTPTNMTCPLRGRFIKHEEKETDIAIAAKLFTIMFQNKCDTAILVTGDTDLTPAVKTCKRLFASKAMRFAFPYRRHNHELKTLLPDSFKIHAGSYVRHLFPDPVELPNGTKVRKPVTW